MKKIYTLLLAGFLLIPCVLSAKGKEKETVRLTRYSGMEITGVSAAHMFQVELIKSNETKAVVEIAAELENYLRFDRKTDGTVSVNLVIPKGEQKRLKRVLENIPLILTVYLPELRYVELEDMAKIFSSDRFSGQYIDLKIEDMGKVQNLDLDFGKVTLKAEDMAHVALKLKTPSLDVRATDMAKVFLSGTAQDVKIVSIDMAKVDGDDLKANRANLKATDMAKASIHAIQYLYAHSTDLASIRYSGNPEEIDIWNPRKKVKKTNKTE